MPVFEPVTAGTHPLLMQLAFAIYTPPLIEVEQALDDRMQAGETSLCVYGAYRSGKSTAALHFKDVFSAKNILVLLIEMGENVDKSVDARAFWDRLRASNGNRRPASDAPRSYQLLITDLEVDADRRGNRSIGIFIDEAQNLVPAQVGLLKELTDELIKLRYSPFVLLFAQPEVQNLLAKLYKQEKGPSVDRFFTQWHYFRGLTLQEIPTVLAAYDVLTFPTDSGVTFSAYFAPSLWREGWRLADEASEFQRAFKKAFDRYRLGDKPELGTKYLTSAVRWLLTTLLKDEKAGRKEAPSSYIAQCVDHCGLRESHRMTKEHRRGDFRARPDMEP